MQVTVRQMSAKIWHVEINNSVVFITHRGLKGAMKNAEFQINRAKIQKQEVANNVVVIRL